MKLLCSISRPAVVAACAVSLLTLSSCAGLGSDTDSQATSGQSSASADDSKSTGDSAGAKPSKSSKDERRISLDTSGLQQVDVQKFQTQFGKNFTFSIGGKKGECFVSAGVVCTGKASDDVPDIEIEPFPKMRPGAIVLGHFGAAYTMIEGRPNAERELEPGQWVNFGNTKCARNDEDSLICESKSAAFKISGKDHLIHTAGKLFDSESDLWAQGDGPVREYDQGDNVLVSAPMLCGAMKGHRLAQVEKGEMTCEEAMEVLDEYDAVKDSEGQGNTLAVSIGEWNCSSPSYARSQQLQASTVCENTHKGLEVRDPVM